MIFGVNFLICIRELLTFFYMLRIKQQTVRKIKIIIFCCNFFIHLLGRLTNFELGGICNVCVSFATTSKGLNEKLLLRCLVFVVEKLVWNWSMSNCLFLVIVLGKLSWSGSCFSLMIDYSYWKFFFIFLVEMIEWSWSMLYVAWESSVFTIFVGLS